MAKPHIVVDLSLLQQFSAPGMWWRIDPRVRKSIASLREVDERVEGVERFSLRIGNEYKPQEDDLRGSRMFLRAALSEFVSMEDAAAFDFQSLGRSASPTIEKLDDPRLHVVRLLRHANVHLSASKLTVDSKPASWHGPDGWHEFQYRSFLVLEVERTVQSTKNACRYSRTDLKAMLDWLIAEQQEWGIQNVVLKAAESYACELAKRLPLP